MRYLLAAFVLLPLSVNPAARECRVIVQYSETDPSKPAVVVQPGCRVDEARVAMAAALQYVQNVGR